ncbi:hypothetical protein [Streptomyces sp. SID5910]|uniref:hypothetical protein n=1 Tax=Streptomyces sp. SID5910 TaxID=2690312 RepID=UPI0013A9B116|nr:hypothetical protein [Streptomyces sp. SID5910]MYR46752.1 hypothetical protein [Streptomyces sp. SID5910]
MSARDDLYLFAMVGKVHEDGNRAMAQRKLDAYRAEILAEAKVETVDWLAKKAREYRTTGSKQHALQAEAIETLASKVDRGAVRAFLGTGHYRDAIDEHRAEIRREILGDDLNPSTLVLDAQAYRALVTAIEATMADPNRWDGDEDEGTILARYVEWLAAGQPGEDEDAPPATLAADTTRRAHLLHAISAGGRWKSGSVARWYEGNGYTGLGVRAARHDLAVLRDSGALVQHDDKGVRWFSVARSGGGRG